MKTFFNLIQEVQKPGLCCLCGGCAAFCMAAGYDALKINPDGKSVYRDIEKCIECGLCYLICPEITDLDDRIKQQAAWSEPVGQVIETTVARSVDVNIRKRIPDGGFIAGLLSHLFEQRRIDGAILTRPVGEFKAEFFLATTAEEVVSWTGSKSEPAAGSKPPDHECNTFSTLNEIGRMLKKGLKRVALVGPPCQIKSLRKMQGLSLVPSDIIKFSFGLFCSGRSQPGEKEIRLEACRYCADYSSEFADISFGSVGAEDGWATVITRTPLGRATLADCRNSGKIEQFSLTDNPGFASQALQAVRKASREKKKTARYKRRELQSRQVQVRI